MQANTHFLGTLFRETPAFRRYLVLPGLLADTNQSVNHSADFLIIDRSNFSEELGNKYRESHVSKQNRKIARFLRENEFILTTTFAGVYLPYAHQLSWLKDNKGRVFIKLHLSPTIDTGKHTREKMHVNYLENVILMGTSFGNCSLIVKAFSLYQGERDKAKRLYQLAKEELFTYESYFLKNQFPLNSIVKRELFLLAYLMLKFEKQNNEIYRKASYFLSNEIVWQSHKHDIYDFMKLAFEKGHWQGFDSILKNRNFILKTGLSNLVWDYGYRS